jgi:hypothetical protein
VGVVVVEWGGVRVSARGGGLRPRFAVSWLTAKPAVRLSRQPADGKPWAPLSLGWEGHVAWVVPSALLCRQLLRCLPSAN